MRILTLLLLIGCPTTEDAAALKADAAVVEYLVEANCVSWRPCTITYTSPDQGMWASKLIVTNNDGDQRMLTSEDVLSVAIEFECQTKQCTVFHSATSALLRSIEIHQDMSARQIVTTVRAVSTQPP